MLFDVSPSIGLPALAALILGESAGLPLPGETALIVAGAAAATGHFSLPAVIAVAAISAIIGDMIGYTVGRRGGRKLLMREGRFSGHRRAAVAKADRYFEKYGVITVFFARFVPGVRVVGAVAAGTTQMRLRSFAIANALGCFAWATTVASIAYVVGPEGAAFLIILGFGIAGIGLISAWIRSRRDRRTEAETGVEIADPLERLATSAAMVEVEVEHLIHADHDHDGDDHDEPSVAPVGKAAGGPLAVPVPTPVSAALLTACAHRPR